MTVMLPPNLGEAWWVGSRGGGVTHCSVGSAHLSVTDRTPLPATPSRLTDS